MCDILDQRIVKTRKPRRCFGCLASITVGSKAERTTYVDGGEIYTNYLCEDCMEFSKTLPDEYWADGCYYEGDLREAKRQEGWKTEVEEKN